MSGSADSAVRSRIDAVEAFETTIAALDSDGGALRYWGIDFDGPGE
jgi:hypothetical protein